MTKQISTRERPIVIAHRGACGYLPEHTLESAVLAFSMGADYIEQDLVATKDGQLVVMHDITVDTVTNAREIFPSRARQDGHFYAIDFDLNELKQLTVHERTQTDGTAVFPNRYQGSAEFKIASFDEQIELVNNLNRVFNKNTGIYPEIKAPAWHQNQGIDISRLTVAALRKHDLDAPTANIYVQCFDFAENQRLRTRLGLQAKLIQLIGENEWQESKTDYDSLITPNGLAKVAEIAQGIGPWLPQLIDIKTEQKTDLLTHAHALGLQVHPYTFRKEELAEHSVEHVLELLFNNLGIDGLFTDFTDTVVQFINGLNNN